MKKITERQRQKLYKKYIKYLLISSVIVLILGGTLIINAVNIKPVLNNINYKETPSINYDIKLKDNNIYNKDTINTNDNLNPLTESINTINTKFSYTIDSKKEIDYTYTYNIEGELEIKDKDNNIIQKRKEILLETEDISTLSNELVIEKEYNLDYQLKLSELNTIKTYLQDRLDTEGITSTYKISFNLAIKGTNKESNTTIEKSNTYELVIPIKEDILYLNDIKKSSINNKASTTTNNKLINNFTMFVAGDILIALALTILVFALDFKDKTRKRNTYKETLNRILTKYNRIIVTGKSNIKDSKYKNIVEPVDFEELVDASVTLGIPIIHEELIKDEKSIFYLVDRNVLYKYVLTKKKD